MTVDIVMTVYDGLPWVVDQVRSLQRQTWSDWRLHVRDDGSTDGTHRRLGELAGEDGRIRLLPRDGENLGPVRGFGVLLEGLPDDSRYVFCCDADDVWMPEKIERSMAAMRAAEDAEDGEGDEGDEAGPLLVHTDMMVVDARLDPIDPSFWRYQDIAPEPVTLPRLIVQNVATGPTILLNDALRRKAIPISGAALNHDWWIALVAAAFGRIVAVPRSTVLYRQHGRNHVGARPVGGMSLPGRLRRIPGALRETGGFRDSLTASARQVEAFLERYGDELDAADREHLRGYAEIPDLPLLARKRRLWSHRALPEHGWMRNLGAVLRG